MTHSIAALDVHKRMLVAVVAAADQPDETRVSKRFETTPDELRRLAAWLAAHGVRQVVMESTAQYWKPVWTALEERFELHLAQAFSNRAPRGRKNDLADAQRLLRRFVAGELYLSFVPSPEQRRWRALTRDRLHRVRDRVQLQNQLEALLEEGGFKLSSVVSDLLGVSARRILAALAAGESDPAALAALADRRLRVSRDKLLAALDGRAEEILRLLLRQSLERLAVLDRQIEELDQACAACLQPHQDAIQRLVEIPGVGPAAAQQIVAEIGPAAASFPSARRLASWIGVCPGSEESAARNRSGRSPKGNRYLRRLLCQSAQAAVRAKGTHFEAVFLKLKARLGYAKAVWAVAHRLARVIWNVLHDGDRYIEHGEALNPKARARAIARHLRALARLGYPLPEVVPAPLSASPAAASAG